MKQEKTIVLPWNTVDTVIPVECVCVDKIRYLETSVQITNSSTALLCYVVIRLERPEGIINRLIFSHLHPNDQR